PPAGPSLQHELEARIEGQELPLQLFDDTHGFEMIAPWETPAAVEHRLIDAEGRTLVFRSIDMVRIEPIDGPATTQAAVPGDGRTFVARYRTGTEERPDARGPAAMFAGFMMQAGIGTTREVLQGAHGARFRDALMDAVGAATSRKRLVTGGFVGFVPLPRDTDERPLVL